MTDVLITIDTELSAGLHQANTNPLDNIKKSIDAVVGHDAFGVGWQMDRMEEHGLKGVFFVDPMPALVYGADIVADMVGPILERRHEVQLHIHTEWLAWANTRLIDGRQGRNIGDFALADQSTLLRCARDLLERADVPRPIAFRAGNYGADDRTLTVLAEMGICWDSSFNAPYLGDPCRIGLTAQDIAPVWRHGVVEIPVSGIFDWAGHIRPAQVCALSRREMTLALRHAARERQPAFVIVSHSFEMLSRDRLRPNRSAMARFTAMCREIARHPDLRSVGFNDMDTAIATPSASGPSRLQPDSVRTIGRIIEQAAATILYERPRPTRGRPPASAPAPGETHALRFQTGERTLWSVGRRLRRIGLELDAVLNDRSPVLPTLDDELDGYDLRSFPSSVAAAVIAANPNLICVERQRYPRYFIRFDNGFDAYMAGFSAKTRSTLRRKRQRWIETAGGLDIREYHRPEAIDQFHALAGALSARTYQERLLKSGLPTDAAALADMRKRAASDTLRAYILFKDGEPASYLYLPIDDERVIYAHLGYEPDLASLSPGTVLQMVVLERLFAERRFRLFDFTEGDGAHKKMFGTDHVDCIDLLLLRRTFRNRLLANGLRNFDHLTATLSAYADRHGIKTALRRRLRR